MTILSTLTRLFASLCLSALLSTPGHAFEPTGAYERMNINGWTVYVSSALAKSPKERNAIISKLKTQTAFIARTLSAKQVKVLRKADIWIEPGWHYRSLARYHSGKGRIFQEDLNPQKYRDVEVFGRFARVRQPSLILHELAHVYHDRKLNWSSARISRLFNRFEKSHASAKDRCGKPARAYALENDNEFFATFTESYFGKTCSYPYDRATIQKHHPEMFALLGKVWGR